MKHSILAMMLLASPVLAQHYNANPEADRPSGASGPGVSYTQVVLGKVIGVGSQIVKHVPTEVVCRDDRGNVTQHSALNAGTIIGGIAGGAAGNYAGRKIGDGDNQALGTAVGAIAGAVIGNQINKHQAAKKETVALDNGCQMITEARIVGWSYTATYGGLQMQGVMSGRQPQIGEDVKVILTSTLYAGD